jgi:hypothetical protein
MASRAVVFGVTADHAFAAGALLASILAHDPGFDATVVIFHDGLAQDQEAAFLRLWSRCRFVPFGKAEVAARLTVPVDDPGVARYFDHLSPLVLAKLELPALLADFDQVVWMDADMLVRGPLDGVWDFDCLAWRPLPQGAFGRREKVLAQFQDRGLDPAVPLLNGGVIGVSRGFLDRGASQAGVHDILRELVVRSPQTQLAEMPWYLVAALNGLPVTRYPMGLNHPVAAAGAAGATIIHAIGSYKFWNATPLIQLYPDWFRHQATWVACGGRPYAGPVHLAETHPLEASEVLRAAEHRAFWLGVFDGLWSQLPDGLVVDLRHDRPALRLLLRGRPEAEHLRLVRVANARRIGLEAQLVPDLVDRVTEAIAAAVPGVRLEKGRMLSVPIPNLATALTAARAAVPES